MATSVEFINLFASLYTSAITAGLPYNLAYDVSLSQAGSQSNFLCTPKIQELKFNLIINPNGMINLSIEVQPNQFGIGAQNPLISQSTSGPTYPPEIANMISLFGIEGAQHKITELFVSALDGTLLSAGFDELALTSLIAKIIEYVNNGSMFIRLTCDCTAPSQDACKVVNSMAVGKNVRFSLPEDKLQSIESKINSILLEATGNNDIRVIAPEQLESFKQAFIDTLNILYQNGSTTVDPNSNEASAIINNFFTITGGLSINIASEGTTFGFEAQDFVLLLSLLNAKDGFPRLTSIFSRLINRSIFPRRGSTGPFSIQPGSLSADADYSNNSILFSSIVQFETVDVDCDPSQSPRTDPISNITTTCECSPEQEVCKVSFLANVVTKPVIYEVPYFYASGRATAELPTAPDVQFIPYKDIDNLILINLNTMAGRYTTKFVPITPEDQEYIKTLTASRGLAEDALLDFEGDSEVQYYEAFRLDYHPSSYTDFQEALNYKFQIYREGMRRPTNVSVFRDTDVKAYSNGLSQEHRINPNTKYYYIFRTIDINDNISNPSKVFEIEMINNGGAVFPVIRVVEFKKPATSKEKVEMRRMVLLSPAAQQTDIYTISQDLIDTEGVVSASEAVDILRLGGITENPIWGKKYKLRFTSIDTGRMLDINITPTTTVINPVENCR